MSLWRLEWLRLTRSHRLVALLAVYLFFGLTGPVVAHYLPEILQRFGGDIVIQLPEVTPADGMTQYTANANQIGLLVAVILVAGALVMDAMPEMSIFLRTRVPSTWRLLSPRLGTSAAAVAAAFLLGLAGAWYETVVLIGPLPAAAVVIGAGCMLVYLGFVVALVAAVGAAIGAVVATAAIVVVALLVLPIVGVIETVGRWLPSHLVGALDALVRDMHPWTEYLPAVVVTIVLTTGLAWLATRVSAAREL